MEDKIEKLVVPSGDWFQIQGEHINKEEGTRYVMSRVIAWALTENSVQGIGSCCYGHLEDRLDYFYVHGDDLSPTGKSWREVFNETPSFNWGLKDITEITKDN